MVEFDIREFQEAIDYELSKNTAVTGDVAMEAGKRFVEILKECIQSNAGGYHADGQLGDTAVDELMDISIGSPTVSSGGCITVPITFSGGGHRMSLAPGRYPRGVDEIVEILNYGTNARGVTYGTWHRAKIKSLAHREGAGFVQEAIRIFMDGEAKRYGVTRIRVNIGSHED